MQISNLEQATLAGNQLTYVFEPKKESTFLLE